MKRFLQQGAASYRLVDWATQLYALLVGAVILAFHNESVPHWPWLAAAHFLGPVAIHFLILAAAARPQNRLLAFLRAYYPILLYTGFYRETGLLNRMFFDRFLDEWFIRLEGRLFGCQPSLEFMAKLPYRWTAELLYAAYFSYYLMIAGVGLALYLRDRRAFEHFIAVVSILFYFCYATYIALPVAGPRIFHYHIPGLGVPESVRALGEAFPFPGAVRQAVFFKIMAFIYNHFEAVGAAFPSSHIAVAWCTVWFSFRYLRRIRWIHFAAAVLLTLSTVYGRYHYVVDVAGGLATTAALLPLINALYRRWETREADA